MITNERNKELSLARFYPIGTDRYRFEYRGVEVTISLRLHTHWHCYSYTTDRWIGLPANVSALEMAAQLRQWILETVPADADDSIPAQYGL